MEGKNSDQILAADQIFSKLCQEVKLLFSENHQEMGLMLWRFLLYRFAISDEELKILHEQRVIFILCTDELIRRQSGETLLIQLLDETDATLLYALCFEDKNMNKPLPERRRIVGMLQLHSISARMYHYSSKYIWDVAERSLLSLWAEHSSSPAEAEIYIDLHVKQVAEVLLHRRFKRILQAAAKIPKLDEGRNFSLIDRITEFSVRYREGRYNIAGQNNRHGFLAARDTFCEGIQQATFDSQNNQHVVKLQKQYSNYIVDFLQIAAKTCEQFLGEAPCPYAVLGLGSLARGTINLNTKIDYAIVLADGYARESVIGYFKEWASLFKWQCLLLGIRNKFTPNIILGKLSPNVDKELVVGVVESLVHIWWGGLLKSEDGISFMNSVLIWGSEEVHQNYHRYCDEWLIDNNKLQNKQNRFCHKSSVKHVADIEKIRNAQIFYLFLDADPYRAIELLAYDLALSHGINVQKLSPVELLDELVNRCLLSPIFARIWREAYHLVSTLRLVAVYQYRFRDAKTDSASLALQLTQVNEDERRAHFQMEKHLLQIWNHMLAYVISPLCNFQIDTNYYHADPLSREFCNQAIPLQNKRAIYRELCEIIVKGVTLNGSEVSVCIPSYLQGFKNNFFNYWQMQNPLTNKTKNADYFLEWNKMLNEFMGYLREFFVARNISEHLVCDLFRQMKDERGVSLLMDKHRSDFQKELSIVFEQGNSAELSMQLLSLYCGEKLLKKNIVQYVREFAIPGMKVSQEIAAACASVFNSQPISQTALHEYYTKGRSFNIQLPKPANFYLRLFSEYPLMECFARQFALQLFGEEMLPAKDVWLLKHKSVEDNKNIFIPVMAIRGELGDSLENILIQDANALDLLSDEDFSKWFLLLLLLDPEELHPGDFRAEWLMIDGKRQLRLIDANLTRLFVKTTHNDQLLVNPILYFCNKMANPFSDRIKQAFLEMESAIFVNHCLTEFEVLNEKYIQAEDSSNASWSGPMLFSKLLPLHLAEKMMHVQRCLKALSAVTHFDLLQKVHPQLYNIILRNFQDDLSAQQRLSKASQPVSKSLLSNLFSSPIKRKRMITDFKAELNAKITLKQSQNSATCFAQAKTLIEKVYLTETSGTLINRLMNNLIVDDPDAPFQFTDLSQYTQQWFINTIHFGHLGEATEQTRIIFQHFLRHDPQHVDKFLDFTQLKLDHCHIFIPSLDFLRNFANLTQLSVVNCAFVQNEMFDLIMSTLPLLSYVNASNTTITSIGKSLNLLSEGLSCPNLSWLVINDCDSLVAIHLKAPKLTRFYLSGSSELQRIDLGAAPLIYLRHFRWQFKDKKVDYLLNLNAPNLEMLDVRPKLSEQVPERSLLGMGMRFVLLSMPPAVDLMRGLDGEPVIDRAGLLRPGMKWIDYSLQLTKQTIIQAIAIVTQSAENPKISSLASQWISILSAIGLIKKDILLQYGWNEKSWRGIKITHACLADANFSQIDLTGADLSFTDISSTNFHSANLTDVCLAGIHFRRMPNFSDCNIQGVSGLRLLHWKMLNSNLSHIPCGKPKTASEYPAHPFFGNRNVPKLPVFAMKRILGYLSNEYLQENAMRVCQLWQQLAQEELDSRGVHPQILFHTLRPGMEVPKI